MSPISLTVPTRPSMRSRLARAWDGDVMWSFRHSPVAIGAFVVLFICLAGAFFAPVFAPHNPFDLKTLNLSDALSPPQWIEGSRPGFPLGTDDQGRDLLSAIMYGA